MNFLNPNVLVAILPLVALPLIVHLFNRHFPHAIRFPNIERIRKSLSERSKLARWRHVLMTLLRTLMVLLALFAFLKPVLPMFGSKPGATGNGRRIILVIDRSLSLEFQSGARTSAAKYTRAEINKILDNLGGDDDVNVILAGADAVPLLPNFTSSHGQVSSMLGALSRGFEHANIPKAIALAESLLQEGSERKASEVYFFSDFQRSNWGVAEFGGFPREARLFFVDTTDGEERPNTAIVRVEPSATQIAQGDVVSLDITAGNWTPDPVLLPVEAIIDGTSSVSGDLQIPAYSTGRFQLEFVAPGEGRHSVEVRTPDDGLAADNHFYLTLDVKQREEVLILSDTDPENSGALFVEAALNPYEGETSGAFAPRVFPTTAVTPAQLASVRKVILSGVAELKPDLASRLVSFVEGGGGMIYFLDGQSDRENLIALDDAAGRNVVPFQVAGKLTAENFGGDPQKIAKGNFKSRFLRLFRGENRQALGLLDFYAMQRALPTGEGEVILNFADGTPALGVSEQGIGTAIFANFTPAELSSNLARQRLFPAWMQEMVKQLTPGSTPDPTREIGSMLVATVWQRDFESAEFSGPDGSAITPKAVGEGEQVTASFTADRPGIYRFGSLNAPLWNEAVNVKAEEESDLRGIESAELIARAGAVEGGEGHFVKGADEYQQVTEGKPVFHWFLIAVAVFLSIEMLLFRPFQKAAGH